MPDREPADLNDDKKHRAEEKKCRTENLRILNDDKNHRAEEKKCRTENLRILNDDKNHRAEEKIYGDRIPADFDQICS